MILNSHNNYVFSNAAFTLNGFDNEERNLTFVKTDFQVLKLKFHACNFKQASILFKNYISRDFGYAKNFYTSFSFGIWLSNLHVQTRHKKQPFGINFL